MRMRLSQESYFQDFWAVFSWEFGVIYFIEDAEMEGIFLGNLHNH